VTAPDIPLVIPAYNEARYRPRLLTSLAAARERYVRAGGSVEIIVADNMSTDDTAQVAADCSVRASTTSLTGTGTDRAADGQTVA